MTIQNDELMSRDQQSSSPSSTSVSYRVNSATLHNTPISPFTQPIQPQAVVSLMAEPRVYHGYMNGYRQPSALIALRVRSVDASQMEHLYQALSHYFTKYSASPNKINSLDDLAVCFGEGLCVLQRAGGLPVFEAVQINKITANHHEFSIWVPTLFGICFHQATSFLLNFFNHHLTSVPFAESEMVASQIEALLAGLKAHAPQGTNSLNFIKAANEENIPWRHVALNAFQYGIGHHSRWLDSTFTDKTSQISTLLARNKRTMSVMLHNAGFPVAEQYVINSEAEALEMARHIGYPVVIKPLDQDGGKGVYARLVSELSVRKAYQMARQHSANLIIERHIPGKDYRLVVLNGKVIWAIERIPAGVTGDGLNSIQTLAQQHNQRHESIYPKRHIDITADTINYLAEQGFTLASVLSTGQFVALNRIANISTGGTPVGVFDKIHPDNQRLAETVARLFRLDIAGVDFISPDIEKSYFENGGKIIEVNAQPQLGSTTAPHLYRQILSTLLPEQGRIPIAVICGHSIDDSHIQHLQSQLFQAHQKVGVVKNNGGYINGDKVVSAASSFQAGQGLLLLNELDALIFCIDQLSDIENQGLPFDRYDNLYCLNSPFAGQENFNQTDQHAMATIQKACRGLSINLN